MVKSILNSVVDYYLRSHNFNGWTPSPAERDSPQLKALVLRGSIEVLSAERDSNPYIKRLAQERSREDQWNSIERGEQICLYPAAQCLRRRVDRTKYNKTPYTLRMALGSPQLAFRSFDLNVLENYRNDPRYVYQVDSWHGFISVSDKWYRSRKMAERDKILLEHFGFSIHTKRLTRAVAAFVGDLSTLSPEHQQLWETKEVKRQREYALHPEFAGPALYGRFPAGIPIFSAFMMELEVINKMCAAMGRPFLFRTTSQPKDFEFLLRPTSREFERFLHDLDKLLSDNLDKKFFGTEVPDVHSNGERKGTIVMLDEWLRKVFRTEDWTGWRNTIETLRKVRKERQKPAHVLSVDEFDERYLTRQRVMMREAYSAVWTIRHVLGQHPKACHIQIPECLDSKVYDY